MSWDPIHDSRTTFLACLRAVCRPGSQQGPVPAAGLAEDPVLDTAAAVLLALLDDGLGLAALGARAESVASLLRQQTGATAAALDSADFVLVGDGMAGAATRARTGGAATPELGATLVYCATASTAVELSGPGLQHPVHVPLGISGDELVALRTANAAPPAGVDIFIAGARVVTALPRSTNVTVKER